MTETSPSTTPAPAPAWQPLNANQRRVLGVLVEKAKTTPAGYPMTLNAIVAGCNQKSNRDPVVELEDGEVERALDELTAMGATSEAPIVSRAVKYRHHAYQWLGVNRAELAVLAELLLRGAQSLGDLRARAARMEPIADLAALKPIVDGLVQRGLVLELTAPGRGQIVTHALYLGPELDALRARDWGRAAGSSAGDAEGTTSRAAPSAGGAETLARLEGEIERLRGEVDELRERVRALESAGARDPS